MIAPKPTVGASACFGDAPDQTIGNNGIDSTPTLIINGTKSAALSWPDLEAALKAAGAR